VHITSGITSSRNMLLAGCTHRITAKQMIFVACAWKIMRLFLITWQRDDFRLKSVNFYHAIPFISPLNICDSRNIVPRSLGYFFTLAIIYFTPRCRCKFIHNDSDIAILIALFRMNVSKHLLVRLCLEELCFNATS